jgi:hypothetical protein
MTKPHTNRLNEEMFDSKTIKRSCPGEEDLLTTDGGVSSCCEESDISVTYFENSYY